MPTRTIVIGAAGAVGKRLCASLRAAGSEVIASDRGLYMPSSVKEVAHTTVCGVDVRDPDSLYKLFKEHAGPDTAVWNLASPLSVETALSPEVAEAVTIGGMTNVIAAMKTVGCRRICFTDSIGSFGASSPREDVAASWLVANPTQDPGSDYGLRASPSHCHCQSFLILISSIVPRPRTEASFIASRARREARVP